MNTIASAEPRSLLSDPTSWKPNASEGVKINVVGEKTQTGAPVLRIDFDFTAGAGYGGAVLELPIDLPEDYEFPFKVRGEGPANNLELKLVDPEGLNVWWINRRAYEWPAAPTRLANQRRHFQFAWGPSGGKPLTKLGHIEIIIAADEGGRGSVWIEDLKFNPLPKVEPYAGTPIVSASSTAAGSADLSHILRGAGEPWTPAESDNSPWIAVDFGQSREIGGLVIHRPADRAESNFSIETSDDSVTWSVARKGISRYALPSEIALPDLQTRSLRIRFSRYSTSTPPAVSRIEFLDTAVSASANSFWRMRAARASRGLYPRTLLNEQSFWTVIGVPDDQAEALINEEGQIEVDRRGVSIEPFIVREGKLLTWADGTHEQSLRAGWMPIPSVVRKHDEIELAVTTFAAGEAGKSAIHAAYTVRNSSSARSRGRMVLAIRPIQVLPPWQDLNITGGWTPIRSVRIDAGGAGVNESNDSKRIFASEGFAGAAVPYDVGDCVELMAANTWPSGEMATCAERSASGVIWWNYDLAAGDAATFVICVPFHSIDPPLDRPRDAAEFEALATKVAGEWSKRIDHATFSLPASARQFHDTLRATQAYILINHDGQGFQPGSRTYNRSWMRDGSMTSAAMLELGHTDLVRKFIDWYAPYQFPSGKVPCVVDRRGADPVNEHDSHGQLIWLIANYHRYMRDDDLVRRHFARVKKAMEYIESLRAERLTDQFSATAPPRQEPGKPPVPALAFRGLVPESISHEGYSAKPMHSFWDTFYILRGLKDATYLAEVAGDKEHAARWQKLTDDFRASLIESIRLTQQAHGIDYLPGCVELGDFDSTSSTILLWPVDEASRFPNAWVGATFNRYWKEFTRRRDANQWEAYTPYELRHVNALVRLGEKDRAWQVLQWYLGHQRPAGWRHWAEVVWREPTTPRMIGDMPHTWVGSDFLNAARTMFVYEDDAAKKLVLFAGVPEEWVRDPAGVSFSNLKTEFGTISASAKMEGERVIVTIDGDVQAAGGIEVVSPLDRPLKAVRVNGEALTAEGNRVRVAAIPATIELSY